MYETMSPRSMILSLKRPVFLRHVWNFSFFLSELQICFVFVANLLGCFFLTFFFGSVFFSASLAIISNVYRWLMSSWIKSIMYRLLWARFCIGEWSLDCTLIFLENWLSGIYAYLILFLPTEFLMKLYFVLVISISEGCFFMYCYGSPKFTSISVVSALF